jgi:hypothetical protein
MKFYIQNEMPLTSLGPNGVKGQNTICFWANKLNTGVPVVVAAKPTMTEITGKKLLEILPFGLEKKFKKGLVSVLVDDGRGPMKIEPTHLPQIVQLIEAQAQPAA